MAVYPETYDTYDAPGEALVLHGEVMVARLTPREREILEQLAAGPTTTEIAVALGISPLTVRSHVKSILAKLGVHSKLEAVIFALRHGVIELPRPA